MATGTKQKKKLKHGLNAKGKTSLRIEPVAQPENLKNCLLQAQTSVEDVGRNYEFHYRRGLVTAMECILRELR